MVGEGQVPVSDWGLGLAQWRPMRQSHVRSSVHAAAGLEYWGSNFCSLLLKLFRTVLGKVVPREQLCLRKPSHTCELCYGCDLNSQKESLVHLS